jgi:hypothetical protein
MSDFLAILLALVVTGVPLVYQGFCVMREKHGYRKNPKYKDHPEMKGVRKGDRMLIVNFLVERDRGKFNH